MVMFFKVLTGFSCLALNSQINNVRNQAPHPNLGMAGMLPMELDAAAAEMPNDRRDTR